MKYILPLLAILSSSLFTFGQSNTSSGYTVTMKGYLINLGGKRIFQPCENSEKTLWEALDNRAFTIREINNNLLLLDATEHIGDSTTSETIDSTTNIHFKEKVTFFPCTIEVTLFLLESNAITLYKDSKELIVYNNKNYVFSSCSILNGVWKIIPERSVDLTKMYMYYRERNFKIPVWLSRSFVGQNKKH